LVKGEVLENKYFEILLEEINSKFNLILEGQVALLKRVDDVHEELAAKLDHNSRSLEAMD
jgi:hypothetical protein